MFGRSHHSKNSGGASAFSSHLFNRRPQLSKPTSSRASDNHAQSVAATSPSGSGAARGYDAYDDVSPVRLVSVRRNAEQTTRQLDNVEGGDGTRVRRTKLGLSVAVVRGPSTMYSAGLSDTCTLSTDGRRDESQQLRSVSDSRHSSNDSSVSVASASASASLPDSNDAPSDRCSTELVGMPAVGRPDIVSEAPPPPQFCRMDVDAWDSSKRNSAVELAQFGDCILPPPELFDTERCCSSLSNDHAMFLLPPPAEFDSVSRASSTADLPLPPPPAFFDVDASTADDVDEPSRCPTSRLHCPLSAETVQVNQINGFVAAEREREGGDVDVDVYDGVGDVEFNVHCEVLEATGDALGSEDCANSCNGLDQSDDTEVKLASDSDETVLVPVSSASSQPSVNASHPTLFAKDAMDKLDELCRSQGPSTASAPSSAAVVIPVFHETTSSAGRDRRVQHQRSLGQSWSDGLFIWDADTRSDVADKSSKRYSAGASLSDMVVCTSAALGARPKMPLPESRSVFDVADWRRRPGVLRAQSAGVGPHHQAAGRRLISRYTPDGRELSVHTETRRVQLKEDLRPRSLEPDDIQLRTSSTDVSRMSSVLSDSSLPSTSTGLPSSFDETPRFLSQQCLSTKRSSGKKNLLEQVIERRNASRMLTPVLGATLESSATSHGCNSDVKRGVVRMSLTDEQIAQGRPVRVLGASSSDTDKPVTCLAMTSAERSMETMKVARPPSLVVRTSTSQTGSPVRVLVAQHSSQSDDDVRVTAAEDKARPSLSRHAPLCSPEVSFDTASEAASGRASPANTSVSTFQGNFSELMVTPGDDTTAGETSTTSTTGAERHFIVVAIDFGTTYSGYAFSFVRDPDSVHMMRRWEGGDPGVVNQKTPTTLLLDPAGKFHSFGYAARDSYHDLDTQEAKKWLYFDKFKMVLHHKANLNKETTIKAANGRSYSALTVFGHALRFFYEHALQELSDQSATTIVNDDIRWVITVPAIWKAPAKQFMRLAAYQAGIASIDNPSQLLIALEPEAASIYVRKLRLYQLVPEPAYISQPRRERTPDLSMNLDRVSDDEFLPDESVKYQTLPAVHLRHVTSHVTSPSSTTTTVGHEVDIEGTRYMVVDCGGGTVDITVYEMEAKYGCLKELHKATGGPYGSVGVDVEFERLLTAIFGSEFIDAFKLKRPAGWVDLMAAFESRKRTASPFKTTPLNVSLPFSFIDYHKKCRSGSVESVIRKHASREVCWSSQGMLRLSTEAMRRLFQPTLERIKQAIGDVLNYPHARDIRYMFLVGGFAESPMLQVEMRKEFCHLLKIIIPQDVALTILKGAVMFGIDPTVVGVRRSRLTYGVGVLHRFEPGRHPSTKKITRDNAAWCKDVFDRFVAVDQEVAVGDVVVRSYTPARAGQRTTIIHIYCSERTDPAFVTDVGVRRCGTLCLDLTDALYHHADTSGSGSASVSVSEDGGSESGSPGRRSTSRHRGRREIRTRMTFGDTEIRVDAVDLATGHCVRAGIDFLNK